MHVILKKVKNISKKRHLFKTITWRVLATLTTVIISWIISGDLMLGFHIGGFELIVKMVLYYFHERVWYSSKFGIKNG